MVDFVLSNPWLTAIILFVLVAGAVLTGAAVLALLSRQLDKDIYAAKQAPPGKLTGGKG